MEIPEFAAGCGTEALTGALDAEGCAIIHDLVPRAIFDNIRTDLERYFRDTPAGEGLFFGRRTKRLGGILRKSPASVSLVMNSLILDSVNMILKRTCDAIQLNLTQAIKIGPGESQQIVHKDDELFPLEKHGHEFMINALWALDDFTADNGATRLAPGSHRRQVNRDPKTASLVPAIMSAGSVLMYLGSVDHCGGRNRTDRDRTGLVISYNLGWLRQTENQYLTMPPDFARELPQDLQRLIGYAIHRPNLGWYEGQDPIVTLRDDVPDTLAARDYFPADAEAKVEEMCRLLEEMD